MTESWWLEDMVTRVGITRAEALRRLEDGDLWLLDPEARYDGTAEEWEDAARIIEDLAAAAALLAHSPAARAILTDTAERCELLAERARQRTA